MFHWIEVNVIHVRLVVGFIPDEVLPKSALPEATLASTYPDC
jgi:hypothetical protein